MSFKQVAVYVNGGLDDYVRRCGDEGWEVCGIAPGRMASYTLVIRKEKTVHDIDPKIPSPHDLVEQPKSYRDLHPSQKGTWCPACHEVHPPARL